MLTVRLLPAFTGVHGSEREHFGRLRAFKSRFQVIVVVVIQAHHAPYKNL